MPVVSQALLELAEPLESVYVSPNPPCHHPITSIALLTSNSSQSMSSSATADDNLKAVDLLETRKHSSLFIGSTVKQC